MSSGKNYYDLIGLPRDATAEDIRRVYRELVRRYHPDSNPDIPEATEQFIQIQTAYEVLSDQKKRGKYDATLPPEKQVVNLNLIYSRKHLLRIQEPQLLFVLMEISAPFDSIQTSTPPLNVCLVLDRSTSMQGSRMDMVKNTAIEIAKQIRPEDILSIVTFGDRAEIILSAGFKPDIKEIEHTIRLLHTGGATEIFQGLSAAYQEVRRFASSRSVNHILLLTDGRTYGDEEQCVNLARDASQRGIGISGLGIGNEWNDTFLDQLASITGGDTSYIEKTPDIKKFLEEKYSRLAKIYADNVKFQMTNTPDVIINYAFRLQPEAGPLDVSSGEIQLGNVPKEEPLKILFEIMVSNLVEEQEDAVLSNGKIFLDIPIEEKPNYNRRLSFNRPLTDEAVQEKTPNEIVKALSQITLYRLQEKAQNEASAGKAEEAAKRLQNLATHLLAQGEDELARTVMIEANNLQKTLALSSEGSKRIKYGTRSLMLPSGTEG